MPNEKVQALRQLIAAKFPAAERSTVAAFSTGVPAFDGETGGLPLGGITELVTSSPSSGGSLLIERIFLSARDKRMRVALIDATDCFDPGSAAPGSLEHLVWVRCQSVHQALSTTELFIRDGNIPIIVLDTGTTSLRDLRKIPAPLWYRLQRGVEPTESILIVRTPVRLVPSAQLRVELRTPATLDAFDREKSELLSALQYQVLRQRGGAFSRSA